MKQLKNLYVAMAAVPALVMTATMASAQGLGDLAGAVTENAAPFIDMIMILAFIGGVFFAISAMLKMKDAKENPRDNSTGTIALNWVAAIFLIFLGSGILMVRDSLGLDDTDLGANQSVTYG